MLGRSESGKVKIAEVIDMAKALKERGLQEYLARAGDIPDAIKDVLAVWRSSFSGDMPLHEFLVMHGHCNRSDMDRMLRCLPCDNPEDDKIWKSVPGLELVDIIASGGMGSIYKMKNVHRDELYALKLLHTDYAGTPEEKKQRESEFLRECKIVAALSHPSIVKCIKIFPWVAGSHQAAICFEWINGPNLAQFIKTRGVLSEWDCLDLATAMLQALHYYSGMGIVHRDIKPENIMLPFNGPPKLADFGIAKILGKETAGDETRQTTLTIEGTHKGSLPYSPPEQILGEWKAVDIRSDIYSLGATLFYCLSGQIPFPGNLTQAIKESDNKTRRLKLSLLNVSPKTLSLLEKMTAASQENRFQTPQEALAALLDIREWQICHKHPKDISRHGIPTKNISRDGLLEDVPYDADITSAQNQKLARIRKRGDDFFIMPEYPRTTLDYLKDTGKAQSAQAFLPLHEWVPLLPGYTVNFQGTNEWLTILKTFRQSETTEPPSPGPLLWFLKIQDTGEIYKLEGESQPVSADLGETATLGNKDAERPVVQESSEDIGEWKTVAESHMETSEGKKVGATCNALVLSKQENGKWQKVAASGEGITVGRNKSKCALLIQLPKDQNKTLIMSQAHLCFHIIQNCLKVKDLGSTNGTYVNQKALQPQSWYSVKAKDEIQLGKKDGSPGVIIQVVSGR